MAIGGQSLFLSFSINKVSPFSPSYRILGFLLLLWLASLSDCALGFELVVRVTNFANNTISVVLHSPLVDISIGAIRKQEC